MTQWVENPEGGRARGPAGIARGWAQVLFRPRWFFSRNLSPGDQAEGLIFAAVVVFLEEATRLALVDGAVPVFRGQPAASAALWLLAAVVLIAPAAIHLVAAVQTLLLMAVAPNRGGVSETVQILCYATAPCVFAGIPSPWVGTLVVLWAVGLLVVGTSVVHDVPIPVAVGVVLIPAFVIFGIGFGGIDAASEAGDIAWGYLDSLFE